MQVIVHFCHIQSSLVHKREKFLMTLEIVHIRHTHTTRAAMPEICNCTAGLFSWKFGCYPCVLTKCSTRETKCTSLRSWQNNYLKLLSHFLLFLCYYWSSVKLSTNKWKILQKMFWMNPSNIHGAVQWEIRSHIVQTCPNCAQFQIFCTQFVPNCPSRSGVQCFKDRLSAFHSNLQFDATLISPKNNKILLGFEKQT